MDNELFDIELFPTSASAKRMLHAVSEDFYEKSYVGKWIYQVIGMEWDQILEIVDDLPNQFFPETATWGLKYHEIKWQLPVRENLSYNERRKLIYQKRDARAPMTPYRMEIYLKNVTGLDVHISDCHDPGKFDFVPDHPNIFRVDIVGGAELDVIIKALKLLNEIKQSHTTYGIYHRLPGGTSDVKTLAVGSVGTVLKVKAWTVDRIEAKETLHIVTVGEVSYTLKVKAKTADRIETKEVLRITSLESVGSMLKVKAILPKQIQGQKTVSVSAIMQEENRLQIKAKMPGKLKGGTTVKAAVKSKTGNSMMVKGER